MRDEAIARDVKGATRLEPDPHPTQVHGVVTDFVDDGVNTVVCKHRL